MTTAEQACKNLYLGIHVSQIKDYPRTVQAAWSVGKAIYDAQHVKSGKGEV